MVWMRICLITVPTVSIDILYMHNNLFTLEMTGNRNWRASCPTKLSSKSRLKKLRDVLHRKMAVLRAVRHQIQRRSCPYHYILCLFMNNTKSRQPSITSEICNYLNVRSGPWDWTSTGNEWHDESRCPASFIRQEWNQAERSREWAECRLQEFK